MATTSPRAATHVDTRTGFGAANGIPDLQMLVTPAPNAGIRRAMAHQDFAGSHFAGHEHRLLAVLAALWPSFQPGKETDALNGSVKAPSCAKILQAQLRACDVRFEAAYHTVLQKAA
jgi:hypothetical protein